MSGRFEKTIIFVFAFILGAGLMDVHRDASVQSFDRKAFAVWCSAQAGVRQEITNYQICLTKENKLIGAFDVYAIRPHHDGGQP